MIRHPSGNGFPAQYLAMLLMSLAVVPGCGHQASSEPGAPIQDAHSRPEVPLPDFLEPGHDTEATDAREPDSTEAADAREPLDVPRRDTRQEHTVDLGALDSPDVPSKCPAAGALLVVEIMIDPAQVPDTMGEYVEFLNTAPFALDLRGWEIRSGSQFYEIRSDEPLTLAPGELFVMAVNGDPSLNGGFQPDYVYEKIRLGNSQGDVSIWCGGGQIDRVAWQSGSWPLAPGHALVLDPGFHDHESNDSPASWCRAHEPFGLGDRGSPGLHGEPCGDRSCGDGVVQHWEACDDRNRVSGDGCSRDCQPEFFQPGSIIVSEFHYSPGSRTGSVGEYVELHNMTDHSIDIAGWTLGDDRRDSVRILPPEGSLPVPPRGYVVLGRSSDPGRNGGILVDWEYGNRFILSEPEDRIILSWNGMVIDRVDYRIEADAAFPPARGRSLNLDSTCFDDELNDYGAFWCPTRPEYLLPSGDFGTPRAPNHPCP